MIFKMKWIKGSKHIPNIHYYGPKATAPLVDSIMNVESRDGQVKTVHVEELLSSLTNPVNHYVLREYSLSLSHKHQKEYV